MKFIMYIWQKRIPILIGGILLALLYFGYNCYNIHYTDAIKLSLVYPGSEKGIYPDNTRFNIYDILSDEVINNTVVAYNNEVGEKRKINPEYVEGKITVTESVPSDLQARIDAARKQGQDYSYFVNEFRIQMAPVKKAALSNGFGILPYVDSELFLNKLYENYSRYLIEHHAEGNVIPTLEKCINFDGYDYLEYTSMLNSQISTYINYLEPKNSENGGFYSDETGMTFSDLITEFKNLQTYQIQNLISFVSSSGLARDTNEFVNILDTKNEKMFIEYLKLRSEGEISTNAMFIYDHTFEENIVIPTWDQSNGLYQARPKTGYDDITQRALQYQVEADNKMTDINENSRKISVYSKTVKQIEEYNRVMEIANSMVDSINTMSSELIMKADLTVQEYLSEKSSNYVSKNNEGKSYLNLYVLIRVFIVFLIAGFLMLLLVMAVEGLKKWYIAFCDNERRMIESERRLDMLGNVKEGDNVSELEDIDTEDLQKLNFAELLKHRFTRTRTRIRFKRKNKKEDK